MCFSYLIGLLSTLPSRYFYILLFPLTLYALKRSNLSNKTIGELRWIILFVIIFSFSLYNGIRSEDPEARNFLYRSITLIPTYLIVTTTKIYGRQTPFDAVTKGVFDGAFLNSCFVILFAIVPTLYDELRIETFSGYDKGIRFLRSPGLQTGTDTAGYLSTIGLICAGHLKTREPQTRWYADFGQVILTIAPIFTSRSAMILQGFTLVLFLIFNGQAYRKIFLRGLSLGFAVLYLGTGILMFRATMGGEIEKELFQSLLKDQDISEIYSFNREGYESHYRYSEMLTVIPTGGSEYFDNAIGKLLSSSGIIPLVVTTVTILVQAIRLLLSKPNDCIKPIIPSLIIFCYLFANLKNNYIFYPLFTVLIFSILAGKIVGAKAKTHPF